MNSNVVSKCVDENHAVRHGGDLAFAQELSSACVTEPISWVAAHVSVPAGAVNESPANAEPPPPILTEDKRRIVAAQTAPPP